ncbi:hypothetical protein Q5752_001002 [Cryptotrichosporon argae]
MSTRPRPAKSAKTKAGAKPPAAASVTAVASSIDDIFASKPGPSTGPSAGAGAGSKPMLGRADAGSSGGAGKNEGAGDKNSKKKVKDKRKSTDAGAGAFAPASAPGPAPTVEVVEVVEVVDPSVRKPKVVESSKEDKGGKAKSKKRDRKEAGDEEAFRDSRGEGPRRKTEEGFSIYKEAELKIDPEAGGF